MSQKKLSVTSGILYLSLVVLGPIALLLIPSIFDVDQINDFASNHLGLMIAWIFADLVIIGVEILLTQYLYKLFKNYNQKLSLYAAIFRFLVVVIMVVNMSFLMITLLSQGSNADVFIPLHGIGVYTWQLSFSFHVFLLGIIIFKYIKTLWRYLGLTLMIGAFGYLIDSFIALSQLDISILNILSSILLVFITISEIGTGIALLLNKLSEHREEQIKP